MNNMRVIIPTLPKCPDATIPEINKSFIDAFDWCAEGLR